jgi:hypothetical protein
METLNYILVIITLLSNVIVWVILNKQIKALKEVNEIKNIDELKKWFNLKIENSHLKDENEVIKLKKMWEDKVTELQLLIDKVNDENRKAV